MSNQDTIFAIATPPGKSGVAIIRISGSNALSCLGALSVSEPEPRKATLARLKANNDELIDQALILWFPGPDSFTGEDVVELHIHGSPAVKQELLTILGNLKNCRLAEAGEFSRRALYNNKMDLTIIEGISDLIESETSAQRKLALSQMEGALSRICNDLKDQIISVRSQIEALLDFPDDEIPSEILEQAENNVTRLKKDINTILQDFKKGEKIREGFKAAIIGEPNVGKSTLINILANREVAITSEHAGTTRDIIEVSLNIDGYALTIADTAGIQETDNKIESEGIKRAKKYANNTDINIYLLSPDNMKESELLNNNAHLIKVMNKCDLLDEEQIKSLEKKNIICISAKKQSGINRLIEEIKSIINENIYDHETPLITRARHKYAFENALEHIDDFFNYDSLDIKAEHLRRASVELMQITGEINFEEILDNLFSSFCIGK